MTDETTTTEEESKGKKSPGEANLQEPVPKDKALFDWLESLFYGTENSYPELIDCRVVHGSRGEKFGPLLEKKPFAPAAATEEARKKMPGKSGKPTREELIELSNRWTHIMQRDCDQIRKPQMYGLHAWHFTADDEPYQRFLKRCSPSGKYANGHSSRHTDGLGGDNPIGVDEDGIPLEQRFSIQALMHKERMFEMYEGGFTGLLDRYHRDLQDAYARIRYLQEQLDRKSEQLERALSLELDREERREWARMKQEATKQGLAFAMQMAPPLINQLAGKKVIKTDESNENFEVITIRNFLKTVDEGGQLTVPQVQAAFGVWNVEGTECVEAGVLTQDQVGIVIGIAQGKVPVDAIDQLMPGGACAINQEQLMGLQKIFPVQQLAPLLTLFQARMNNKKK